MPACASDENVQDTSLNLFVQEDIVPPLKAGVGWGGGKRG